MAKNIILLLAVSIFLALIYNFSLPKEKQFPLFKQEPVIQGFKNLDEILAAVDSVSSSDAIPKEKYINVGYDQVKFLMENPDVQIIDARPTEEWEENRIGDAINIFPYDEEDVYFQKILEEIPREKSLYLIYCHGGTCDLSHMLADDMSSFDLKPIVIYVGGWEDWLVKEGISTN